MPHDLVTDHADRIGRALARIETGDPDSPPDLAELAEIAAFSPFHFHRVFRLMTGETVGAAMRRIRLARSLNDLTDGTRTVTEAMAGSGYASSQAFARAMKQATGASATSYRADPELAKAMAARLREAPDPISPLGIEVVSLDPFRVVALRREGPYEALNDGYDALFEKVFAQTPMDALAGIWGVPLDDPASVRPEARAFDCALDIGAQAVADNELADFEVGGGNALAMDHIGSYDNVPAAFDALYLKALRDGHALSKAPPIIAYHDQPEDKPEHALRATLYLPVA
ncbi:AraC family transcriptional regulator [Pseudoblastomonas halimionae]|uniref:Helix-turn-helix domain-containing protein n=1 Tax=Alteriqipengyuania halimionae TaxID=1926630 RepID=A0A6I4U5N5_9SPHN|nr:AraC family transcriptional regulator [Alteriqipengyuania halimionae]MXP11036.1 helix-turn-helix domain-containing protein [Alteriqipengyuania halimionae]